MKAYRFHATLAADRVIRLPEGLDLHPGDTEVILLQAEGVSQPTEPKTGGPGGPWDLVQRLARAAEELGGNDLPEDLALNHDHYLYGCPKRTDQQ